MKNIALFCDGTWQHLDQPFPTNVAKLARAALPEASGRPQIVYYDDGVGVGQGVLDSASHLLGGALGNGLDYKIMRAYEFLCLNYEPGDRIFIFGFSRGAYTARSLAGMLRLIWILRRDQATFVGDAMTLYRCNPKVPDTSPIEAAFSKQVDEFRQAHCYASAPYRDTKSYVDGDPESLVPPVADASWVHYVGVWDTVGSLGIPTNLPFSQQIDAQYRFYDTALSKFVRSARHAVSIDERRVTFEPTLWANIAELNDNAQAGALAYDRRPYQQRWFPGAHGGVGGGGDDGGLSLASLLWIAEGAARAGFAFDPAILATYANMTHPDAPFVQDGFSLGGLLMQLDGLKDRDGPDDFDEISLSARLRWALVPSYRPPPLKQVRAVQEALDGWGRPDPVAYFAL